MSATIRTPRSEGDQQVKISELNLSDAAKGNRNVPLFLLANRVIRPSIIEDFAGDSLTCHTNLNAHEADRYLSAGNLDRVQHPDGFHRDSKLPEFISIDIVPA